MRRVLRILLRGIAVLAGLLVMLIVLVQFPSVQTYIADKAVGYVSKKMGTRMELDRIALSIRGSVIAEGLYVEDLSGDTLAYIGHLDVRFGTIALLRGNIDIRSLSVYDVRAYIYRTAIDSAFNFDFFLAQGEDEDITVEQPASAPGEYGEPTELKIGNIRLERIYAVYRDEIDKINATLSLGFLHIDFDEINPGAQRYSIGDLIIDDVDASVDIQKPSGEVKTDAEPSPPPQLEFDGIFLSNINLRYNKGPEEEKISLGLNTLHLTAQHIDIPSGTIDLSSFTINGASIVYEYPGVVEPTTGDIPESPDSLSVTPDTAQPEWDLFVASLNISDSEIEIRDLSRTDISPGLDASNISLHGITVDVEKIRLGRNYIAAHVNKVAFRERNGFEISDFKGFIIVDDDHTEVLNLTLKTGASRVSVDLHVEYPSIAVIDSEPHNVHIRKFNADADLDLTEFQKIYSDPNLIPTPIHHDQSRLKAALRLAGTLSDVSIDSADLETGSHTILQTHGTIKGLPDPDSVHISFFIDEFSTRRTDIEAIIPGGILPEQIRFPETLLLTGEINGSMQELDGSISVTSSIGNADVQVAATTPAEGPTTYVGALGIDDFNVGSLLSMEEYIGRVSTDVSVKGRGTDADSLFAELDMKIHTMDLLGYRYKDIIINGEADHGRLSGHITIDEEFIKLSARGATHLNHPIPHHELSLSIDRLFFNELNLTGDELYLHGRITADIAGESIGNLNGYVRLDDVLVIDEGYRFPVDSLVITTVTDHSLQEVTFTSHFLNGSYRGNLGIGNLPDELIRHTNRYFSVHTYDENIDTTSRNFEFNITLSDPSAIPGSLLPELDINSPLTVTGVYESMESKLDVAVDIPEIVYSGYTMHSLRLQLGSDLVQLYTSLELDKIESSDITVYYPVVSASVTENFIKSRIRLGNADNEDALVVEAGIASVDTGYIVSIEPTGIILNGERWMPSEGQHIFFGAEERHTANLRLEKDGSFIEVMTSIDDEREEQLEVLFEHFPIDAITGNIKSPIESLHADLYGSITINDIANKPRFLADLSFERVGMGSDTLGNIEITARSDPPDTYLVNLNITRNGDYAGVEGSIITGDDATKLDLAVTLDRFGLAFIEPFTFGTLRDITGSVNGRLSVRGKADEPAINGSITFSDVEFQVVHLNSTFILRQETIAFDDIGMQFRAFTLRDFRGNTAVINGVIGTEDRNAVRFNLDLRSTDFTLMNTTWEHNDLVYGRIVLNSDVRIRGLSDNPAIDGNIGLRRGTAVTVVLPETDLELVAREGIVTFAEIDAVDDLSRTAETESDTLRSAVRGLNVTVNVQVDPQTELTVIVDPRAGDQVVIHGGGDLSFGIDPSGFMSLAGRYEINDGSYQLSFYDVARRGFDIRPGSSIVWSGDPLDAEIDISGIYSVRTSPLELVGDQVSEQTRQQYRQPLPFQVYLNMKGKLLEPEINFTLDMPPDQRGAFGGVVYRRVQQLNEQETELNKQVFSLLILNRFIAENPFDISEGGGLSARARSSASRIMTQQLNALSGRYLRGLVISFDIESYEDYTEDGTIGRTELQLQVSQRFLDDRIIVELGGNVDLEGERKKQIELMDIAGDIAVEYLITQDGRYRLRGFRETEYHGLVDGEITTTGLSLVLTRDFNTFTELFRKPRVLEPVD